MEWGIRFSVRQFWWMCMSQAVKSLEPPNDRIPLTLNMTRTKRLAECGRNAELELDRVQKVINPWLVSHVDLKPYSWFHSISFHSIPCVRIQKSHFLSQTYSQTIVKLCQSPPYSSNAYSTPRPPRQGAAKARGADVEGRRGEDPDHLVQGKPLSAPRRGGSKPCEKGLWKLTMKNGELTMKNAGLHGLVNGWSEMVNGALSINK